MTMLNYWDRIIRGQWHRGLEANHGALDAEPRSARRKTRREPWSKSERAEAAEGAEKFGRRTIASVLAALVFAVLAPGWAAVPAHPQPKRPQVAAKSGDLASLVTAWRESPTPARRAAVESYAAAHVKDDNGALARLALGVGAYEQKDYATAISTLRKAQSKLAPLADYAAYYLALSRVESKDTDGISGDLAATHATEIRSPFAGKAWLVQARSLQVTDAAASVRMLREHYAELPQPEGDVALADSYQAANQLPQAAEFYQRVYYQYLTGDAANRAAAALLTLKDTMGAAYPQPLPEQVLRRADRLLDLRDYGRARSEYESVLDSLVGVARDQARVRMGAADFLAGKAAAAGSYLRGLELSEPEAAAERLYYLVECARHLNDDGAMMDAIHDLAKHYPKSPWRLKALQSAGNRFLLVNRPDDYVPLYQAVYQDFPAEPLAGLAHWKVTFQAYLHDKGGRRHAAAGSPAQLSGAPDHRRRALLPGAARRRARRCGVRAGLLRAPVRRFSELLLRDPGARPAVAARGRERRSLGRHGEVPGRPAPGGGAPGAVGRNARHHVAHRAVAPAAHRRAGGPGRFRTAFRLPAPMASPRCSAWKSRKRPMPRTGPCTS